MRRQSKNQERRLDGLSTKELVTCGRIDLVIQSLFAHLIYLLCIGLGDYDGASELGSVTPVRWLPAAQSIVGL